MPRRFRTTASVLLIAASVLGCQPSSTEEPQGLEWPSFTTEASSSSPSPAWAFVEASPGAEADFSWRADGHDVRVSSTGLDIVLPSGVEASWRLVDGRDGVAPRGDAPTGVPVHWYRGTPDRWARDLQTFSRVVYDDVWPGVDLELEPRRHGVAYRFLVEAGADASRIGLAWEGVDAVTPRDGDRGRDVKLGAHTLEETGLRCFEEVDADWAPVDCRFEPRGDAFGVAIDARRGTGRLVVDPTITWGSYLGVAAQARGVAVDPAGNQYVVGNDVAVTKVNANGSLAWTVVVGGTSDQALAVVADLTGAYVVGHVESTNFATPGAFDTTFGGGSGKDGFVTKISAAGTVVWSTYLGGSGHEVAGNVALDAAGNVLVVGSTSSTDFPTVAGLGVADGPQSDCFITKVHASGASLVWSSLLAGNSSDGCGGVTLDPAGNVYVAGGTQSSDLTTPGAWGQYNPPLGDGFVGHLSPDGATVDWLTAIGGHLNCSFGDGAGNVALDPAGNVYIAGYTTCGDFPIVNGFDNTLSGGEGGFVAKFDPTGSSLLWSTFVDGAGPDTVNDMTASAAGLFMVGEVLQGGFPLVNAFDTDPGTATEGYVMHLGFDGAIVWSSYLGGSLYDAAHGVALASPSTVFVAGSTDSPDLPTPGGFNTMVQVVNGVPDTFLVKIGDIQANGAPCASSAECQSGICEDGICCAAACGLCSSCDPTGSTCSVVPADDEACGVIDCDGLDTTCADYESLTTNRCEGQGDCKAPNTADCTTSSPLTGPCDDGDLCTLSDNCQAGLCVAGTPTQCVALDECHDVGTCDASTGVCSDPSKPDGSPCAGGSCVGGVCTPSGNTGAGGSGGVGGAPTGPGGSSSSINPAVASEDSGGCAVGQPSSAPRRNLSWLLLLLAVGSRRRGLRRPRAWSTRAWRVLIASRRRL